MRLNGVSEGDILDVDIRGQQFVGRVTETGKEKGKVTVEVVSPTVFNRQPRVVGARQIKGIYRKAAGSR